MTGSRQFQIQKTISRAVFCQVMEGPIDFGNLIIITKKGPSSVFSVQRCPVLGSDVGTESMGYLSEVRSLFKVNIQILYSRS